MAALAPIVEEAGGRFTSADGQEGPWHGTAMATNGLLHDEVLAIVAERPSDGADRPGETGDVVHGTDVAAQSDE